MESSQLAKENQNVEKLHQQFMNLQQDWDSFKQSNPKTKRRYSYSSSTNHSNSMVRNLQLLDTSPRNLMSSLQSSAISPLEGAWKVRTNDLAVQEIIRERREAIKSGKLKGRRLFQGFDNENVEMGFEPEQEEEEEDFRVLCDWNGFVQESEVRSMSFNDSDGDGIESDANPFRLQGCSSSSRSSISSSLSLSGTKSERKKHGEGVVEGRVKEENDSKNGGDGNWGRKSRNMVLKSNWVAFIFFVLAICIIRIFGGRFGYGYGDESQDKVILIPT